MLEFGRSTFRSGGTVCALYVGDLCYPIARTSLRRHILPCSTMCAGVVLLNGRKGVQRAIRSSPAMPSPPPPIHHGTPFSGGIDSGCIDDVLSSSAPGSRAEAGAYTVREVAASGRETRVFLARLSAREAGAGRMGTDVACSDSDGSLCLAASHPSSASRPRPQTPTFFCSSFSPAPIRPRRLPRAERAGCTMYERQPNLAEPRYTTPKV
ncbi:hypothetical protein B0H14DRAFT_3893867 [Mycena olivaceomarginata]|nr:hypothetical protein B0H14DRAFT_3893867 [Mycena olivaceomarginata]